MSFDGPLLLDTHLVIWLTTDPGRVPSELLSAVETASSLFVSHVTALEVQLKSSKHGPRFQFSLQDLEKTIKAFSCKLLPITYEDISELNSMPFIHQDPFDRLLMTQARRTGICLATLDREIIATFEQTGAFSLFADHLRPASNLQRTTPKPFRTNS